jgi:hypothetical protein
LLVASVNRAANASLFQAHGARHRAAEQDEADRGRDRNQQQHNVPIAITPVN